MSRQVGNGGSVPRCRAEAPSLGRVRLCPPVGADPLQPPKRKFGSLSISLAEDNTGKARYCSLSGGFFNGRPVKHHVPVLNNP